MHVSVYVCVCVVSVFVSRVDVHTYVPYALCMRVCSILQIRWGKAVYSKHVFDEHDRLSAVVGVPIEMDTSVRPVLSTPKFNQSRSLAIVKHV